MKEVPLQCHLDLLGGSSEARTNNFEFDDFSNQHWVIPCHLHCHVDQGNQTSLHKRSEGKESETPYVNCSESAQKLHQSKSTERSEIMVDDKISSVCNSSIHVIVNEEEHEDNAYKYDSQKSDNAHMFLQNNTSSTPDKNADVKDSRHNVYYESDCILHSPLSTLLNKVRNSSSCILGYPGAFREKVGIVPSLNFHRNEKSEENSDFCHIHLSRKCQNSKTQITQTEIFHLTDDTKSANITSLTIEIPSNGARVICNDKKDERAHECLQCHVSSIEQHTSVNQNIHLQEVMHHNKKPAVAASYGMSSDKHHLTQRKDFSSNKECKDQILKKSDKRLSESFCTKYLSCRWKLAYLCFLARFIQTALRQCMGIAVIGMTLKTNVEQAKVLIHNTNNTLGIMESELTQEFHWSSAFEGVVMASFNIGSIITPIIVGYLTTRYGGRRLMTACLLSGGVLSLVLPVAARTEPALLILFRIFTGIALSGTDSLIQAMWARWAPLYETASLSSCAYTGLSTAGVLTYLVCGYIVSIGGEGRGWPYIFYIFGSMCLLLAPLWYVTVYDSPEDHPRITKKELAIITFNKQSENCDLFKQEINTPWRRIIKSSAVWAIVMGQVTHKWVLSFMLSYLPRYFADMFDFDMKTDGLFSSLPFAGRVLSGAAAGYISDWMLRKGVSTRWTRKFFQATGCCGCAVFSLLLAFIPSLSSAWSISLLVMAMSCQDLTSVAFRINLLDIAPRYAGILNGVVSTIATLTSLPAPVITSLLISGGSQHGWQILFCLVAALNISGGLFFVMFAKGEIQDWAQNSFLDLTTKPDEMIIYTLEASKDIKSVEHENVNPRALWKYKSLPVKIHKCSTVQVGNVGRRATLDVGIMMKRVQNQAFLNLALADL